jgi:hypothetical protein
MHLQQMMISAARLERKLKAMRLNTIIIQYDPQLHKIFSVVMIIGFLRLLIEEII